MSWFPSLRLLRLPRASGPDLLLLALLAALVYGLLAVVPGELKRPAAPVDLQPRALPGYAGLSLLRMTAAYGLSLGFALVFGYAAARSRRVERVLVPLLDVLQSVPVLSFMPAVLLAMVAVFPRQEVGLEVASVVLIFTGMVWNLTFSFYHSLLTLPQDLVEAARLMRLSGWQRFTLLELPAAAVGLAWNSVMSWAGGWFFLMACEAFVLVDRTFTLPGLGSYLAEASSRGDLRATALGLGTMVLTIVVLDQLVWRPVVAWSQKFKLELTEDPLAPRSWFLDLLRRSALARAFAEHVWAPLVEGLDRRLRSGAVSLSVPARWARGAGVALAAAAVVSAGWGLVFLARLVARVPPEGWAAIAVGAAATSLRVLLALALAALWTVPVGVAVGLRPRWARVVQPLAQVAASVPATALFPVVLLVLLRAGGGLQAASVLVMLLGTQWYLLFNVIAGASALPRDLQEAAASLRLRGVLWWRTFVLPAIFPYLVTGGLTAQGGAWNTSIVSEFLEFGGRRHQVVGLGGLLTSAVAEGNMPLLAAATVTMAGLVVAVNRLVWRRLARLAEERYHL
jgi:NitT/TauT family transport system permease protein